MKLAALLLSLLASIAIAAPVDVRIVRSDGLATVHHAQSKKASVNGPPTSVEGELEIVHSDDFDRSKSEYHYRVKDAKGKRTALNIDSLPTDIRPRSHVLVQGKRNTRGTALDPTMEALDPTQINILSTAAITYGSFGLGNIPVLFALIQYNNASWDNPGFGPAQMQPVVDQLVSFYKEGSYGQVTIVPTITSVVTVHWSSSINSTCDTGAGYYAGPDLIAANPAWDPAKFTDVVYIMPTSSGCGWKGLANVGACCAWIAGPENAQAWVIAHEMGHTFGNWHAGAGGGLPGSMWGVTEYGDGNDAMGNNSQGPHHFNAWQKRNIGWLPASATATYPGTGTQSYTLDALEEAGGKVYELRIPTGNVLASYTLEYRKPEGWDAGVPEAVYVRAYRPLTQDAQSGTDDTVALTEHVLAIGGSYSDIVAGLTITVGGPSAPPPTPPPTTNNLLVNGGFETPAVASYTYSPTGGTWTFAPGSGIQKNGSPWGATAAPDGAQTAFIQSGGSISQTVTLAQGSFTLSFKAAQRSYCNPSPCSNPITVAMDGATLGTAAPSSTAFQTFTFQVNASAGSHTFTFTGTAPWTADRTTFIDSMTLQ